MTREQEIEKAARDLIRAYGYSVTPGDPMRMNEYEALQELRRVCGFPRGVLPAVPPPSATAAPAECPRCLAFRNGTPFDRAAQIDHSPGCSVGALAVHGLPAAPAEKRDGCSECADRQCYRLLSPGDGDEVDPTKPVPCPTCGNNPAVPAEEEKCPNCRGSGHGQFEDGGNMHPDHPRYVKCPACHGTGRAPSRGEEG